MYHICFCCDDNYAKYMAVTITSILKNSLEEESFTFHIIETNISDDSKNKIISLKRIKDFNIFFYRIEENKYNNIANYLRLYIPELIKEDKVLYLDCDIIVNNSLKELFEIDIDNYYVCAVRDLYVDIDIDHKFLLNFYKEQVYFNSGVILINNYLCIRDNISNTFFSVFKEKRSILRYVDQDILNYVFKDKVKIIDKKWNFYPFRDYNFKYTNPTKEEAIIVHFVGHKPWNANTDKTYFIDDYWYYYQYTPWFFEEPITAIQTMMKQKLYDYDSIRLRSNHIKLFGIYTNSHILQFVIFGVRITIDTTNYRNILNIAWWIPIKKYREKLKNTFR